MVQWKTMRWLWAITLLAACNDRQESKGMLEKAPFAALTDSIKKFPANTALLLRRAELLSQHELHELANEDYKKAWASDSSEYMVMPYVANLFLINKPREAVRMLQNGVKRFPENPEFRRRLSEAYLQSGRSQEALAQYDNILQQDSSNFEAWYEKGLLLLETKDTAAAINALARSYALQPLNMNGLALANLYAETKDPLAVTIADDVLSRDSLPENIDPVFIKGIYYSNTKQYALAMEQFDKIIQVNWKFSDAYIEKGIILFEEKNIDGALETFKMAATVSATNPDAYYWQGRCYEAIDKPEEAMDNYFRAYALDRQFVQAKDAIERLRRIKTK